MPCESSALADDSHEMSSLIYSKKNNKYADDLHDMLILIFSEK